MVDALHENQLHLLRLRHLGFRVEYPAIGMIPLQ